MSVTPYPTLRLKVAPPPALRLRLAGAMGPAGPPGGIASQISFTPTGSIAANNVQDALAELAAEKANIANTREKLTAARTYFVRTDGNDSNTGLVNNAGGAFLTIQKAIDTAATLDLATFNVTISVADGTYTGGMVLKSLVGAGSVIITGNTTTPTNCIVSVTSGFPVNGSSVRGVYTIQGFHLKAVTAGFSSVFTTQQTVLNLNSIRFEAPNRHVSASAGSQVFINSTGAGISTAGAFNIHIYADTQAIVQEVAQTITITGTPAIGQAWAFIIQGAVLTSNGNTYSGAATGKRWECQSLGYIFTGTGGGATYFPGNANGGPVATGGIYD